MSSTVTLLRGEEELVTFTNAMQHELEANAHKGDWRDVTSAEVVHEVLYHAVKLALALAAGHKRAVLEYSADVANSALIAAHSSDALHESLADGLHAERLDGAVWRWRLPFWKACTRSIAAVLVRARLRPDHDPFRRVYDLLYKLIFRRRAIRRP